MGWQTVSKWLIFGLILGLVLGFAGGYSYKALNAEAPVTNTNISATQTGSDLLMASLASVMGGAIYAGLTDTNKSATNSVPSTSNIRSALSDALIPSAQAQTITCSGANLAAIKQYINDVLKGKGRTWFIAPCTEEMGTVTVNQAELYAPASGSGSPVLHINYTVDKTTILYDFETCKEIYRKREFKVYDYWIIDGEIVWNVPPSHGKLICKLAGYSFNFDIKRPCPCWGTVEPTVEVTEV